MSEGASEADLGAVESALDVHLPTELRGLLRAINGFEGWYGDEYLVVYGTDVLVVWYPRTQAMAGRLCCHRACVRSNHR